MRLIKLTRGLEAIVDDDVYEEIMKHKWHTLKTGYAARSSGGRKNKKMVYMHRAIMKADIGISVDHINGNKLDNRRENLRLCSHSENCRNSKKPKCTATSKYKGVYWDKTKNAWAARIKKDYIGIFLGRYPTEIDAARAYNQAAITLFGVYARLNEIDI